MSHTIPRPLPRARRLAAAAAGALPAAAGALGAPLTAAAAAAVGALPAVGLAQNATSNLRGVVTGANGAPVADAQVQVRNPATGARRGALTNASGAYNVGGLQPGVYEVRVIRIGFTPAAQTVRLTVGEVTRRDFRLGEAAVQLGTVVATAAGRSTDRATSEVAATVSTEQIENLPQNNRNFLDFATLAPGVQRRGSGLSSGGQSENQSNLFIDGASYKSDLLSGGIAGQNNISNRNLRGVGNITGNPFPQSAVQEFRVVTQNYKAEYQRASGAVVTAATKAGTNELTGEFFAYGQNRNLLATNYWDLQDRIDRPTFSRAQFGGSLGGPIVRDKAHFFASFEGNYIDLNSRVAFRPPPAFAAQVPDSLLRGQGQYATPFRSNLFFGRTDYTISDRQSLIFTANVRRDRDARDIGRDVGPEGLNNVRTQIDNYLLRHTFSAGALTNEAQTGFQRQNVTTGGDAAGVRLNYGDYAITRGVVPSLQRFRQNKYTLRDDLTYTAGAHVLKGGVITEFLRYDLDKRNAEYPLFEFNPPGVGNPAGLGIGVPYRATLEVGNALVRENNAQFGAYLQDDWTVGRRLTLNLGVRWDVETNALNNRFRTPQLIRDSVGAFLRQYPYFDAEQYFNDGPSDRKRFLGAVQPRLGFSYDVEGNGRTLVFGGGGVYYDRVFADILLDERLRTQRPRYTFLFRRPGDPAAPNTVAFSPDFYSRDALIGLVQSGVAGRPEAFLVPDDLRPPRSDQASLGVRHERGGYQFTLTGTAVNGVNGFRYVWGNREIRPGAEFGAFRTVPGLANILRATDAGRSWYRALLFQASRPFTEGRRWGGDFSYTLAKSETNTRNGDDPFALDYVSEGDIGRIRSLFDERHRVVLNVVTRIPLGIRASTVTTLGSGLPYLTSTNCDETQAQVTQRLAGDPGDARQRLEFCQANGFFGNGNGRDFDDNPAGRGGVWGSRPEARWFGPFGKWAFRQVDLRLQKDVAIPRGQRASVFFDVYNVFNFVNFNYQDFSYGLFNDRARRPLPFSTYDARRAQLGVRYSL